MEEAYLAFMIANMGDWDSRGDTIVRRAMPLQVEQFIQWASVQHNRFFLGLVATAEGPFLDAIGLGPPPVFRRLNEEDSDYRFRIITAHFLLTLGNLTGYEIRASNFNPQIIYSLATVSPNRQDIRLYNLMAEGEQLPLADRSALSVELNLRPNIIGGVELEVIEPTVTQARVNITGLFDRTLYSEALVTGRIRTSVYSFIDENSGIGNTWFDSKLCAAATVGELVHAPVVEYRRPTSGTEFDNDADLGVSASELTARDRYTGADFFHIRKNETDVLITVRGVNDP